MSKEQKLVMCLKYHIKIIMNDKLITNILELLNPLSLDERYKVLEDLRVSLDEIEATANDLGI